jgi:hypothetical protein
MTGRWPTDGAALVARLARLETHSDDWGRGYAVGWVRAALASRTGFDLSILEDELPTIRMVLHGDGITITETERWASRYGVRFVDVSVRFDEEPDATV